MKHSLFICLFGFLMMGIYACHNEPVKDQSNPDMAAIEKMMNEQLTNDTLRFILHPTNQQVLSTIPLIKPIHKRIEPEFRYQGIVSYIPENSAVISSKITGRIETVFVKYKYQKINKGQKLFTIYSDELLTEQNNLLFLLQNDANNLSLIETAKNKLRLLGCSEQELNQLISSNKVLRAITVYSNYSGFITELTDEASRNSSMNEQNNSTGTPSALLLKQGIYVQKGQAVFSVVDNSRLWAILSIPSSDITLIAVGNTLRIKPEANQKADFRAEINYIEPVLNNTKKTVNARVVFDNTEMQLPIGSGINSIVFGTPIEGNWLPASAVLDLGTQKAVLVKEQSGFKIRMITTAINYQSLIQLVSGIDKNEQLALNAQYVMDSESFIKQPDK